MGVFTWYVETHSSGSLPDSTIYMMTQNLDCDPYPLSVLTWQHNYIRDTRPRLQTCHVWDAHMGYNSHDSNRRTLLLDFHYKTIPGGV